MKLTDVMEALNKSLQDTYFPESVLNFFASFLKNGAALPTEYVTSFEASFLEFSPYGTLRY